MKSIKLVAIGEDFIRLKKYFLIGSLFDSWEKISAFRENKILEENSQKIPTETPNRIFVDV